MRKTSIILALTLSTAAAAEDKMATTTIQNGNNFATVTQSGDPGTTVKKVEKRPGYTRIEQQTGNSRSVIVQSTDPADMPKMDLRLRSDLRERLPADLKDRLSPEMRRRLFAE